MNEYVVCSFIYLYLRPRPSRPYYTRLRKTHLVFGIGASPLLYVGERVRTYYTLHTCLHTYLLGVAMHLHITYLTQMRA